MSFLLDTNIVSETTRERPSVVILEWIAAQMEEELFVSAITIGELRYGALLLAPGAKRRRLLDWIETGIKVDFARRILPVTQSIMECWADIQSQASKSGRHQPAIDSIIAATALTHDLTLVTRNVRDFAPAGITILNPWKR